MGAPIKNTVGAAVTNHCTFSCNVEWSSCRRWLRWRCSCGAVGLWERATWAAEIVGQKGEGEQGSWWNHVLTWHGREYE